ncbi:hypothetical protein, partial [[Kitasatospora] papulosa]|uniref:hypothetical protein n=1 Tax=[Kitasatospora] papulosa TaxID=1464011 RepID=UPI0036CFE196
MRTAPAPAGLATSAGPRHSPEEPVPGGLPAGARRLGDGQDPLDLPTNGLMRRLALCAGGRSRTGP